MEIGKMEPSTILRSDNEPHLSSMDLICDISKLLKYDKKEFTDEKAVEDALKNTTPEQDDRAQIDTVINEINNYAGELSLEISQELKKNADSVALIVRKSDLLPIADAPDRYAIKAKCLSQRQVVVAGRKVFFDGKLPVTRQPSANSLGTGFFYRKNYLVTAAHVLFPAFRDIPLADLRFIRGNSIEIEDPANCDPNKSVGSLANQNPGSNHLLTVNKKEVFKPAKNRLEPDRDYKLSNHGDDYAIVQMTPEDEADSFEQLSGHVFLTEKDIARGYEYQDKAMVYGLGHGHGIELSLSPCGRIISQILNSDPAQIFPENLFQVELDFVSGNSGSLVLDGTTHKAVGMLISGRRDVYFSDSEYSSVFPGVLENGLSGETCLKLDFLSKYDFSEEQEKTFADEPSIPQKNIIPYTFLGRVPSGDGRFHLYINIVNENRKVTFSDYPVRRGNITYVECFLDALPVRTPKTTHKTTPEHSRHYEINKPRDTDHPDQTEETIEVRVVDRVTGIYHISVLEYINSKEIPPDADLSNDRRTDALYWVSCFPESLYQVENAKRQKAREENKANVLSGIPDMLSKTILTGLDSKPGEGIKDIGLSAGYYDEKNNFITSAITAFDSEQLKEQGLRFTDENEELKEESLTEMEKENAPGRVLRISRLSIGDIKKPTSVGGPNDKPTHFLDPEDIVVPGA
ncbi:MAG: trypsin-like peptidase domain-containing protein [Saprospiraceae bacterium]